MNFSHANEFLSWVAGDWNLADMNTKKQESCRKGYMVFKHTGRWTMEYMKYNPELVVSEKRQRSSMLQRAFEQMDRDAARPDEENELQDAARANKNND